MNKLHLFSLSFVIFLITILLAYEITLHTITLTPTQQTTFNYLLHSEQIPSEYNSNEENHLKDVKSIMNKIPYILLTLTLILATSIYYTLKKEKKNISTLFQGLSTASLIAMIGSLIFTILSITLFPTLFTYFHTIFFPQGNWIFPQNSYIITTFPEEFFQNIALHIGITTILLQLAAPITNVLIKRKKCTETNNHRL